MYFHCIVSRFTDGSLLEPLKDDTNTLDDFVTTSPIIKEASKPPKKKSKKDDEEKDEEKENAAKDDDSSDDDDIPEEELVKHTGPKKAEKEKEIEEIYQHKT